MAGKYKELAEVLKQECIAPDIYSMWLQTDKIAEQAVPGQFISVYSNDGADFCRVRSVCVRLIRIKRHFVLFIVWQEKERRSLHSVRKVISLKF